MSTLSAGLAAAWTLGGVLLLFGEAGSHPWWDVVWVLLLTVTAYVGLVAVEGLSRARLCAGVVLVVFAGMVVFTALTGWPFGPLRFAGPTALRLGNAFPLLPPLLCFALLSLSQRAAGVAFPALGVGGLALVTSGLFTLTLLNGLAFLAKVRLWWLWNPWVDGAAILPGLAGLAALALAAFFLARIYPVDSALKLSRWSAAGGVLIAVNGLFFASNGVVFFVRL